MGLKLNDMKDLSLRYIGTGRKRILTMGLGIVSVLILHIKKIKLDNL